MEDSLKTLIERVLSIPCYIDASTLSYPCATVEDYLENPEIFGDGRAKGYVHYIQVTLYYPTRAEAKTAVDTLVPALSEYTSPTVERYFDTNARKYRADLKFSKGEF